MSGKTIFAAPYRIGKTDAMYGIYEDHDDGTSPRFVNGGYPDIFAAEAEAKRIAEIDGTPFRSSIMARPLVPFRVHFSIACSVFVDATDAAGAADMIRTVRDTAVQVYPLTADYRGWISAKVHSILDVDAEDVPQTINGGDG